jgi:hypothetical protein
MFDRKALLGINLLQGVLLDLHAESWCALDPSALHLA